MTSLLPSMTADGLDGFLAFLSDKGYGAPQTTTAFLQDMAEYGVSLPTVSANSAEAAYLEQGISQLLPAISQLYSARESITAGQSTYDANAAKLEENKKLEARAKASEQGKMKDRMERATLESELHNLRNFVDRIPPEVLAQVKRQQRHTVKER